MKIKVIAVGKIKQKETLNLIEAYLKQLRDVEIIEISDEKDQYGMELEGKKILDKISEQDYVVGLAIEGKALDSLAFAEMLDKIATHHASTITFVIGGSWGLSTPVKARANLLLSFSKLTFPHNLVRLLLIEQIYRAQTILKNHPYHK